MTKLLTGATSYVGKRSLLKLLNHGHKIVCTIRDKSRFSAHTSLSGKIEVIEVDLLDFKSLKKIPSGIEGAYFLMNPISHANNY